MAFSSDRRLIKDFAKFNKLQQVDQAARHVDGQPMVRDSSKVSTRMEDKIALQGQQTGTNFQESTKHLIQKTMDARKTLKAYVDHANKSNIENVKAFMDLDACRFSIKKKLIKQYELSGREK